MLETTGTVPQNAGFKPMRVQYKLVFNHGFVLRPLLRLSSIHQKEWLSFNILSEQSKDCCEFRWLCFIVMMLNMKIHCVLLRLSLFAFFHFKKRFCILDYSIPAYPLQLSVFMLPAPFASFALLIDLLWHKDLSMCASLFIRYQSELDCSRNFLSLVSCISTFAESYIHFLPDLIKFPNKLMIS